ncbi:hypothetical protein BOC42_06085 [Burkholderia pseudomallei]|nr:hypothetical protein BOC42_06085 [Burkholderia pseudomallei]
MESQTMRNEVLSDAELGLEGFIRQRKLLGDRIFPASAATLWRHVKEGKFPAPVKLSIGITAWRVADVVAWQRARLESTGAK